MVSTSPPTPTPAPTPTLTRRKPLSCADYAQYDLRLTRQGDGAPVTVPNDEDDSTAHIAFGAGEGTVFRLEADCRLHVPESDLYGE